MPAILPLHLLQPGEIGRIAEVRGCKKLSARLMELGLDSGAQIRVIRGGESCVFAVGSQRISLRLGDECTVLVALEDAATVAAEACPAVA